jgi:hypothetical protein
VKPAGPEYELATANTDECPDELVRYTVQMEHGLALYPIEWVSGELHKASAIFAEITPQLKRQVCRVSQLPAGLTGFQGAAEFDFYHSPFRSLVHKKRRGGNKKRRGMALQSSDCDRTPADSRALTQLVG